jgi:anti-sigma regulatory factor (Ser/Thr protein kinase)
VEAVLNANRSIWIELQDPSQVSAARLGVQAITRELGFDETRAGGASIAVTEAATNVLRHGGGGAMFARPLARDGSLGVEVIAIDGGSGIESFEASSRDGVSTAGSAGTGLGAIQRKADEFDFYTQRAGGTVLRMVFWNRATAPDAGDYDVGAVCVPKSGEDVSGDAWAFQVHAEGATFMVADGLGHGLDACRAASLATEALSARPLDGAAAILELAHGKLRASRGAAVAVMRHERASGEIAFAGAGNIAACLWEPVSRARRAMVSQNGIVGHTALRKQEYRYPWPPGALLIAHSDGLESQWDVAAFPGLAACPAAIIAAVLHREHSRRRDDVVVLVVRKRNQA